MYRCGTDRIARCTDPRRHGDNIPEKLLFIQITLIDCNGLELSSWPYDEYHPVIPPRFTYPNLNDQCAYQIRFRYLTIDIQTLPVMIDLNLAISDAIQHYVTKIKQKGK